MAVIDGVIFSYFFPLSLLYLRTFLPDMIYLGAKLTYMQILHVAWGHTNIKTPTPKQFRGPGLSPHYAIFGRTKRAIFKICPRVPKLQV